MSRSAAGAAPADGRGRPRTRAAVLCAVAACLALVGTALLGSGPLAPAARAAPVDDVRDKTRPVTIEVSRFEPRSVVPGALVTISGTLTNTGDQPISRLGVRLQRGEVMTTREELAADETDPDPAGDVVLAFQDVPGRLAPGDTLPFTYVVPADELRLERDGVYPVLLNLNGTTDGGERRRVGEVSTFLVRQPAIPAGRTAVAWLWPLVERTHRTATGAFADDGLAAAVASGGRLERALAAVEDLPRTAPPAGGAPVPTVPVTLAIDPALVEELGIMAAGPYTVGTDDEAGRGTQDAADFLDRLRAVAAVHTVVALPYGDVDADALETAGLGQVVTRSLPATGTAQNPPQVGDGAPATSSAPGVNGPADEPEEGAGAAILADALGVEPRTDIAWLADGTVRPETLAALQTGGAEELVLGAGALDGSARALGLRGGAAAARAAVALPGGSADVLVADPGLGADAAATEQVAGGIRIAEQRHLADLALLSLQAPADPAPAPTVLVAPPRDVSADPDGVRAMMTDTAELPWLRAASVAEVAAGPTADAGTLVAPAEPSLDGSGLAAVAGAVAARDDLAGAVVGPADTVLAASDAAIARATSVAWRADPRGFQDAAVDVRRAFDRLRDRVTLLAPADGTYSLASSDAPLVLTVQNDLPFAVRVRLDLRTRGNLGLSVEDIGVQELAPGERTTLQVPTHLRQSGRFAVTAAVTTPSGSALGERVSFQVKSTAYGAISLIITIGAAALLGLLFLRRAIRFVLRRRRGGPPADGLPPEPGPEGAVVPLPPTRSPV